jgi:hypothetical protein
MVPLPTVNGQLVRTKMDENRFCTVLFRLKETFSLMLLRESKSLTKENDRRKTTAVNDKEVRLFGTSPVNNGLDESQNDCQTG